MTSNLMFSALARLAALTLLTNLSACGKQSDAIVWIAVHPTNPNILYISTNERVYKTRDGGQSWEKFPDFSARRVTTIAVDPQLPATVFTGTMGDAVYKSSIAAPTEPKPGLACSWPQNPPLRAPRPVESP